MKTLAKIVSIIVLALSKEAKTTRRDTEIGIIVGIVLAIIIGVFISTKTSIKEPSIPLSHTFAVSTYAQETLWNELNAQVVTLYQQGRYSEASKVAEEALKVAEKTYDPNHTNVATSLSNLAELYREQGRFSEKVRDALGEEHPDFATYLHNLAELYHDMGMFSEAEPFYLRALVIREKNLGKEHPDVATALGNLALLYHAQGRYAGAEPLLKQALKINEKALPEGHIEIATSLNNLAALYHAQGRYAEAESLHKQALEINKKAYGEDDPDFATSLNNLALLYKAQGRFSEAEPLYLQAKEIYENALRENHPDVATSLNNLADLYACMALKESEPQRHERHRESHSCFKRAAEISEEVIEDNFTSLSERQKMEYIGTIEHRINGFLSHTAQYLRDDSDACMNALDGWLRWKGCVMESQSRYQEAVIRSGDPEVKDTYERLTEKKREIAHLSFSGLGKMTPEVYKGRLGVLYKQKDELEGRMSSLSKEYSIEKEVGRADCKGVAEILLRMNPPAVKDEILRSAQNDKGRGQDDKKQSSSLPLKHTPLSPLDRGEIPPHPQGAVLIEFTKTWFYDFKEGKWQEPHYLAFVLTSNTPLYPLLETVS